MSLPYLSTAGVGYGSRILTFTGGNANGTSFICNEYDPTEPTAQTMRTTELGAPNGWVGFEERRTLRGQLQFATNATPVPDRGDPFVVTRRTTATNGVSNTININYVVTEIGMPERPRDFWVCDIQALENK